MVGLLIKPNDTNIKKIDISDTDSIRKILGGYFEMPIISIELRNRNIDVYVVEDGKFRNLDVSAIITYNSPDILDYITGNIIMLGHDEDGNAISLNESQLDYLTNTYIKFSTIIDDKRRETTAMHIFM